jgi:hypothetical protein
MSKGRRMPTPSEQRNVARLVFEDTSEGSKFAEDLGIGMPLAADFV